MEEAPRNTPVDTLLIDDDEHWLTLVVELLSDDTTEFNVATATSLAAGRQQFADGAFDCVVCDYRLGDGTGLELLSEVRDTHSEVPFIIVTSRGDESVAADAISHGVTDYILKDLIREDFDHTGESVLAAKLRKAVESYRTQRALTQEREIKTAAMDLLTTMSNQPELYQRFCDLLHTEHGYEGVWLGTVGAGGRIIPRAVSGCGEYLQELNIAQTTDDSLFDPAVRALEQDSVAISGGSDDRSPEPWSDEWNAATAAVSFDAGIGVPLGDDRVQFGVLGAYTKTTAPDEEDVELLREFARLISYSVRTDEWTESMIADEPVRLEIEIGCSDAPLVALAEHVSPAGSLELQSVAKRNGGEMLYSINVRGVEAGTCREYVEGTAYITLHEVTETADGHRCVLIIEPPTPESIAREYGLQIEQTDIQPGLKTMTGYLSTDSAVPNLLADLKSTFEHTTVTSVTSTMATNRDPTTTAAQLLDPLTTRQREILLQAVHAGYFENPRAVNATELADWFGIARPTLTEHLRTAQQKLFETLLNGDGQ